VTNEALLAVVRRLKQRQTVRICASRACGAELRANRLLLRKAASKTCSSQPAANDAGNALGACYYLWNQVLGGERVETNGALLPGPSFARTQMCLLRKLNPEAVAKASNLPAQVARLIAQGARVAAIPAAHGVGPRSAWQPQYPRRSKAIRYGAVAE